MAKITEVLIAVARLEGKVDILVNSRDDHEQRLRQLERIKFWIIGAAATVGYLATFIPSLFKSRG